MGRFWVVVVLMMGCGSQAKAPASQPVPAGCVEAVRLERFACHGVTDAKVLLEVCEGLEKLQTQQKELLATGDATKIEQGCEAQEKSAKRSVQDLLSLGYLKEEPPNFQPPLRGE